jgi:Ca2+-binding RTX toxin-like protein
VSGTLGYTVTNLGAGTTLTGSGGNDTLIAGNSGDTLIGGGGDDRLTGGIGVDRFIVDQGTDAITNLSGTDVLRVDVGATANATVTAPWTADIYTINKGTANLTTSGSAVNLAAADVSGTLGYTVTNLGAGTTLTGSGGNDTLIAGNNGDTLIGGGGDDRLTGGIGVDRFIVDQGTDAITNLSGTDVLRVNAGATANATVTAPWTADIYTINKGTANLTTSGSAVNLAAADVFETLGYTVTNLGAGTTLTGSGGNDTLIAGDSGDTLIGGLGNDALYGGMGNDVLFGDNGFVSLDQQGNWQRSSSLSPTQGGNDILFGGKGNDVLIGGAGSDLLGGNMSEDILFGDTASVTFKSGLVESAVRMGNGKSDLIAYTQSSLFSSDFDAKGALAKSGVLLSQRAYPLMSDPASSSDFLILSDPQSDRSSTYLTASSGSASTQPEDNQDRATTADSLESSGTMSEQLPAPNDDQVLENEVPPENEAPPENETPPERDLSDDTAETRKLGSAKAKTDTNGSQVIIAMDEHRTPVLASGLIAMVAAGTISLKVPLATADRTKHGSKRKAMLHRPVAMHKTMKSVADLTARDWLHSGIKASANNTQKINWQGEVRD